MANRSLIFVCFTVAYFLSQFFRSANAVITPDLARDLSLNAADLGLMTSLFFATFALVQLPLGVALDKWEPRWVAAGLMAVGVAGSLVFAVANTFIMLTVGRALLGVGMAGILMGGLKAMSQSYPSARFATVAGLLTGAGSLGALVATTPLAWLNALIGWRAVFVAGALLTGASALSIVLWARSAPVEVAEPGAIHMEGHLRTILGGVHFWRIAPLALIMLGMSGGFRGL